MAELDEAEDALERFHATVDGRVRTLADRHRDRLHCRRGCAACCVDDLRVRPIEAKRIRRHHGALLRDGAPHPVGACAFLDDAGACRIYADRPYVCRTQGLPLRWFDASDDAGVERRDICPENAAGPPLEQLSDVDCWLLGPHEAELAHLDEEAAGGRPRARVPLRSLFASGPSPDASFGDSTRIPLRPSGSPLRVPGGDSIIRCSKSPP